MNQSGGWLIHPDLRTPDPSDVHARKNWLLNQLERRYVAALGASRTMAYTAGIRRRAEERAEACYRAVLLLGNHWSLK